MGSCSGQTQELAQLVLQLQSLQPLMADSTVCVCHAQGKMEAASVVTHGWNNSLLEFAQLEDVE